MEKKHVPNCADPPSFPEFQCLRLNVVLFFAGRMLNGESPAAQHWEGSECQSIRLVLG